MNGVVTSAIVLSRTNYGEADRILTVLTPDQGKQRLIAKAVRKTKSKLAGGIELLSESQITYIPGKRNIGTLISSRLIKHYSQIVKDVERTMLGYALLKQLNKATEDPAGKEYYDLMIECLAALNDHDLPLDMVELWFNLWLLKLNGRIPNVRTTASGGELDETGRYGFNYDKMAFMADEQGEYTPRHIKLMKLVLNFGQSKRLKQIENTAELTPSLLSLVKTMYNFH